MCHHAQLTFVFLVETEFHHVGQAGLKPLTPSDLPVSASKSVGITGISHRTWPLLLLLFEMECYSVTQSGVQWHELGSLQLPPPWFNKFSASASQVAGITGTCHHTQLIFVFLVEMGFHHVG